MSRADICARYEIRVGQVSALLIASHASGFLASAKIIVATPYPRKSVSQLTACWQPVYDAVFQLQVSWPGPSQIWRLVNCSQTIGSKCCGVRAHERKLAHWEAVLEHKRQETNRGERIKAEVRTLPAHRYVPADDRSGSACKTFTSPVSLKVWHKGMEVQEVHPD